MSRSLHLGRVRKWLIQSPPSEWLIQYVRDLLLGSLRQGPVPQHVAFVMDGNRRFARNHQIEVIEGHNLGFEALARVLEVCYKLGVKTVTIYAFSIENFKRSKYEVNALMEMAKVKLTQLAQHGDLLARYGAKMQFLGQRDLIRKDVLEAIDQAIAMTSGNGKAILNICAPYTSRDEMTTAMRKTVSQFTQPLQPRLKRPFSETRISRTIRAQRLSISEGQATKEPDTPTTPKASRPPLLPQKTELSYAEVVAQSPEPGPASPTEAAYEKYVDAIIAIAWADEELEDPAAARTNPWAVEVSDKVLAILKRHPALSEDETRLEIEGRLMADLTHEQFTELVSLAAKIDDYVPPLPTPDANSEQEQDHDVDDATTLAFSTTSRSGDNNPNAPSQTLPDPESITADTINANTFTGPDCPPLDILVRTSGVERLSDFMLWQCHKETEIAFLKCMWPEFDLWHFLPVLLEWQAGKTKAGFMDAGRGTLTKVE